LGATNFDIKLKEGGVTNFGLKFKKFVWCLGRGSRFQGKAKSEMRFMPGTPAYKAYHAMLDKIRAENSHLSEAELDAKLYAARDAYCRKLREDFSS
jgi:hypothetical protein